MTPKRDLKKQECGKYLEELKKYKASGDASRAATNIAVPLHLSSFRVFLAYNNLWKLINRNLITKEEYDIMKEINCYREPRSSRNE